MLTDPKESSYKVVVEEAEVYSEKVPPVDSGEDLTEDQLTQDDPAYFYINN